MKLNPKRQCHFFFSIINVFDTASYVCSFWILFLMIPSLRWFNIICHLFFPPSLFVLDRIDHRPPPSFLTADAPQQQQ